MPDSGDVVATPGPIPGPEAVQSSPGAAALSAVLDERRTAAVHRVVEVEPCLVARADLIGHADGIDPPAGVVPDAHALVSGPVPGSGVTGVRVRVLVLRVAVVARGARVREEPDLVALDRPAQREVAVPVLQKSRRFGEAQRAQLVVDVGGLAPLAGPTAEDVPAETVAASLGDDVERGGTAVGFAQAAGDRHLDFDRVVHVVRVVGHTAAVERRPDVQAVDLNRALVGAAATGREEVGVRPDTVVEARCLDGRQGCQVVAVASRRWKRPHDVATEHGLLPGRLQVDDRRFTRDRDALRQGAHAQLGVDRRDAAAGEFHSLAHDRRKALHREGDRVGPRRQAGDLILPAAIGDGRAGLFDERRTRRLHGDTGQHGAGRVAHGASQRLSRGDVEREKPETRGEEQGLRKSCHHTSSLRR